jgi:hypothetical protein
MSASTASAMRSSARVVTPLGLPPVVEAVERGDVGGEDPLADDLQHPRVGAAALLVAGRAVDEVAAAAELLEYLEDGGS